MHSRSEGGKGQFGVEKNLLHRECSVFVFGFRCLFGFVCSLTSCLLFFTFLKGDKEGNFCLKQHMSVVVGFCAFSFCREAKKTKHPPQKRT
jgi:hypothetical protein